MRRIMVAAAFILFAGAPAVQAQQTVRIPRIGILTLSVAPASPTFDGFRQGLRDYGYVDGENVAVKFRFAQGKPEMLGPMAAELECNQSCWPRLSGREPGCGSFAGHEDSSG